MGYITLAIALTLNAVANILMKAGSANLHYMKELGFIPGLAKNYVLFIGLLLFAGNVAFYAVALSKLNLSVAYPIMVGGGFLIITLYSALFLKEAVSGVQIVGILLLLAGILIISTSKS